MSKDGGPAFPSIAPEWDGIDSEGRERYENGPSGGMSLRDYFAAAAIKGMLASHSHVAIMDEALIQFPDSKPGDHVDSVNARLALSVYRIADAMLAERVK